MGDWPTASNQLSWTVKQGAPEKHFLWVIALVAFNQPVLQETASVHTPSRYVPYKTHEPYINAIQEELSRWNTGHRI